MFKVILLTTIVSVVWCGGYPSYIIQEANDFGLIDEDKLRSEYNQPLYQAQVEYDDDHGGYDLFTEDDPSFKYEQKPIEAFPKMVKSSGEYKRVGDKQGNYKGSDKSEEIKYKKENYHTEKVSQEEIEVKSINKNYGSRIPEYKEHKANQRIPGGISRKKGKDDDDYSSHIGQVDISQHHKSQPTVSRHNSYDHKKENSVQQRHIDDSYTQASKSKNNVPSQNVAHSSGMREGYYGSIGGYKGYSEYKIKKDDYKKAMLDAPHKSSGYLSNENYDSGLYKDGYNNKGSKKSSNYDHGPSGVLSHSGNTLRHYGSNNNRISSSHGGQISSGYASGLNNHEVRNHNSAFPSGSNYNLGNTVSHQTSSGLKYRDSIGSKTNYGSPGISSHALLGGSGHSYSGAGNIGAANYRSPFNSYGVKTDHQFGTGVNYHGFKASKAPTYHDSARATGTGHANLLRGRHNEGHGSSLDYGKINSNNGFGSNIGKTYHGLQNSGIQGYHGISGAGLNLHSNSQYNGIGSIGGSRYHNHADLGSGSFGLNIGSTSSGGLSYNHNVKNDHHGSGGIRRVPYHSGYHGVGERAFNLGGSKQSHDRSISNLHGGISSSSDHSSYSGIGETSALLGGPRYHDSGKSSNTYGGSKSGGLSGIRHSGNHENSYDSAKGITTLNENYGSGHKTASNSNLQRGSIKSNRINSQSHEQSNKDYHSSSYKGVAHKPNIDSGYQPSYGNAGYHQTSSDLLSSGQSKGPVSANTGGYNSKTSSSSTKTGSSYHENNGGRFHNSGATDYSRKNHRANNDYQGIGEQGSYSISDSHSGLQAKPYDQHSSSAKYQEPRSETPKFSSTLKGGSYASNSDTPNYKGIGEIKPVSSPSHLGIKNEYSSQKPYSDTGSSTIKSSPGYSGIKSTGVGGDTGYKAQKSPNKYLPVTAVQTGNYRPDSLISHDSNNKYKGTGNYSPSKIEQKPISGVSYGTPKLEQKKVTSDYESPKIEQKKLPGNSYSPPKIEQKKLEGNSYSPPKIEQKKQEGNSYDSPTLEQKKIDPYDPSKVEQKELVYEAFLAGQGNQSPAHASGGYGFGPSGSSSSGSSSGSYGEENYEDSKPMPYEFQYEVKDDEHGSDHYRREKMDENGYLTGSYGYRDPHGLYRQVEYQASKDGFKVSSIKTNEPGTDNQDPADVHFEVEKGDQQY